MTAQTEYAAIHARAAAKAEMARRLFGEVFHIDGDPTPAAVKTLQQQLNTDIVPTFSNELRNVVDVKDKYGEPYKETYLAIEAMQKEIARLARLTNLYAR